MRIKEMIENILAQFENDSYINISHIELWCTVSNAATELLILRLCSRRWVNVRVNGIIFLFLVMKEHDVIRVNVLSARATFLHYMTTTI